MLKKFATAAVLESVYVPETMNRTARRALAHRHHFDYTPRPGFLYVRSRMISSRCNDNFDEFPAEEIEKGWRTFIGKPVFVNHHNDDHRKSRGVIIDAALHRDVLPSGAPDVWCEGLMEVDAKNFPKLAKAIIDGDVDRTSMGCDVDYSICSICGNKATSPAEYCQHIPRMKGQRIWRTDHKTGKKNGVLVREICYGLRFFENSLLVEEPADPTAYFTGVDASGLTMAASKKTAAWSQERHPEPIVHTPGRRPARPLMTGDTLLWENGHSEPITSHSESLLMTPGGIKHRRPVEGDDSQSIFSQTAEDVDRIDDAVGASPAQQDFLRTNPIGPTKWSSKTAIRGNTPRGEDVVEPTLWWRSPGDNPQWEVHVKHCEPDRDLRENYGAKVHQDVILKKDGSSFNFAHAPGGSNQPWAAGERRVDQWGGMHSRPPAHVLKHIDNALGHVQKHADEYASLHGQFAEQNDISNDLRRVPSDMASEQKAHEMFKNLLRSADERGEDDHLASRKTAVGSEWSREQGDHYGEAELREQDPFTQESARHIMGTYDKAVALGHEPIAEGHNHGVNIMCKHCFNSTLIGHDGKQFTLDGNVHTKGCDFNPSSPTFVDQQGPYDHAATEPFGPDHEVMHSLSALASHFAQPVTLSKMAESFEIPLSDDDRDFYRQMRDAGEMRKQMHEHNQKREVDLSNPIDMRAHMLEAHDLEPSDFWRNSHDQDHEALDMGEDTDRPLRAHEIRALHEHDHTHTPTDYPGVIIGDSHFHHASKTAELSDEEIQRGLNLPEAGKSVNKGEELGHHLWNGIVRAMGFESEDEMRLHNHNKQMVDLKDRYGDHPGGRYGWDDRDKEGDQNGEPYYEVKHPASGFTARDYGGANVHIYHAATPDEAHDLIDAHDRSVPKGETGHRDSMGSFGKPGWKHPQYGHDALTKELHDWVGESGDDYSRHDPRIRRWQQRNGRTAAGGSNDRMVTCTEGHQHWGAEGAAGLLLRHRGHDGQTRYLLQKRGPNVDHPNTHSIPGGALAKGETPIHGAIREGQEEMHALPNFRPESIHVSDCGGWKYHTVIGDVDHQFDPPGDGNEHGGASWLTADEIDGKRLHPGFESSWSDIKDA